MKKSEFLAQLRKALENDMDAKKVKENIDYYDDYIRNEVEKGQSEEAVLEELGDPWALAKTLLLSDNMGGQEYSYSSDVISEQEGTAEGKTQFTEKWKVVLAVVAVIMVLLAIFSLAFGVIAIFIRLAIQFAFPILIIVLIIKLFSKK